MLLPKLGESVPGHTRLGTVRHSRRRTVGSIRRRASMAITHRYRSGLFRSRAREFCFEVQMPWASSANTCRQWTIFFRTACRTFTMRRTLGGPASLSGLAFRIPAGSQDTGRDTSKQAGQCLEIPKR
jgi:hypothetical protein